MVEHRAVTESWILFINVGDFVHKIGENSLDYHLEDNAWQEVKEASMKHLFFHWDLEFLDIFYDSDGKRKANPGFDAVVGNPPWDTLKPDVEEFFSPLYAQENREKFRLLTKTKKNQFVKNGLKNKITSENWNRYNEDFKKQISYFNSGQYPFQSSVINDKKQSSDLNLYKLFTEKSYYVLNMNGLCGLVIPSGIYLDLGTRGLRQMLFENTQIKSVFSFINKKGIFEGIHKQFKFCILIFVKGNSTNRFLASFDIENVTDISTLNHKSFDFDMSLIKLSSPKSLSIIECKNRTDLSILKKLYQNPILSSNKWRIQARSEFHMTGDSNLFHTLIRGFPLYEGKMIYQFSNSLSEPRYHIDEEEGIKHLFRKEEKRIRKVNKNAKIKPQIASQYYRLVWRDVTNSVDRRTLIATILPPNVFLGNTLNYIVPIIFDGCEYVNSISTQETIYLCGMFNSFPVDFILRHRVNLHVNIFHLMELPIPRFNTNDKLHKIIYENTARLICTHDDFSNIMLQTNIKKGETNAKERLKLQAQVNAASCKTYKIDRNELQFILEYFSVEDEQLKDETLRQFDML